MRGDILHISMTRVEVEFACSTCMRELLLYALFQRLWLGNSNPGGLFAPNEKS